MEQQDRYVTCIKEPKIQRITRAKQHKEEV